MTKSDPLILESTINALTGSDDLKYTIEIRHSGAVNTRAHGKGMRILLEGHDISHLVTDFSFNASNSDAVRVTIDMVGLRSI